jgi:hypothetical protein
MEALIRVTIEDLDVAAEWLDINDGDNGEKESCRAVAAWLRKEVERRYRAIRNRRRVKP